MRLQSIISHIFIGKGIYNCMLHGNYCFNITSNVRLVEVKSRLLLIMFIWSSAVGKQTRFLSGL